MCVRTSCSRWLESACSCTRGGVGAAPEVNKHRDARRNVEHFLAFVAGLSLLALLAVWGG
ncbi:MAG TPA: hypothetical protein VM198_08305 [Longimicrobiales bacterium]|nr:hypothetical protein [Longimicrobiales bacterium]